MPKSGRLWIVEKPDVAAKLAAGLRAAGLGEYKRESGYYLMANGDKITNLFGHMLEMLPPNAYLTEDQNRGGYFSFLPLLPEKMKYRPRGERDSGGKSKARKDGDPAPSKQYSLVVRLIREASEIVNAGDVDREGQLIVDELLEAAGVDPTGKTKPVWRFPLVSTREDDIVALFRKPMESNADAKWVRRRLAAVCRQELDWLIGMNSSMAFQEATGYRSMSAGRVQSPVLHLVVERDEAIEAFKPRDYFVPVITLRDGTEMVWSKRAGAEGTPGFDAEGRIISEAVAKEIVRAIQGGLQGNINAADHVNKAERPPLPFSMGTLQSTAAKRLGMTVKGVTAVAQTLYERHKAITYVGTDCQFLPESMHADAQRVIGQIARAFPKECAGSAPALKSQAFNDAKIDEHFAIVPTGELPSNASPEERAVFDIIARRYLSQFYPNHEYIRHSIAAMFGKDEFRAATKEVVRVGWKSVDNPGYSAEHDAQGDDEDESQGSAQKSVSREGARA